MKYLILVAALAFSSAATAQNTLASESYSASSSQSSSGSQSSSANNINVNITNPNAGVNPNSGLPQRYENVSTSTSRESVDISSDINSTNNSREAVEFSGDQTFRTNNSVFLAAAVSMSSDYCGGTASGGASALGWSVGGAKPIMDYNCQKLRRAEKFGMAAVSAYNMGMRAAAAKLQYQSIWELCTVDDKSQAACLELGLITEKHLPNSEQPTPVLP